MKKLKGIIERVDNDHAVLSLNEQQAKLNIPLSILPDVAVGSTVSVNLKVEDKGSVARQDETVELFTEILDRSCPR